MILPVTSFSSAVAPPRRPARTWWRLLLAFGLVPAATTVAAAAAEPVTYRTAVVDQVEVFYREAGPSDAPTLVLLHGFPSSSRMFNSLLQGALSERYHLVAPDYPGFGHSGSLPDSAGSYTFDSIARVIDHFLAAKGLDRYVLYLQDYGGPVGFRIALAHPERVRGLIIQNAVSHEEGLGEKLWAPRRAFWADRAARESAVRANLASSDANRLRHVGTSPHPERYDPDLWTDESAFLARPGVLDRQIDLFYDYRTNVAAYPRWQEYLRDSQPPTLVAWGRYDPSFDLAEVAALQRDLPKAEVRVLDAGHFALDEAAPQIAQAIASFLDRLPR